MANPDTELPNHHRKRSSGLPRLTASWQAGRMALEEDALFYEPLKADPKNGVPSRRRNPGWPLSHSEFRGFTRRAEGPSATVLISVLEESARRTL